MNYECQHCKAQMKRAMILCNKCAVSSERQKQYGIRTASDYALEPGDSVINALCFLHACGVLDQFLDRGQYFDMSGPISEVRPDDVVSQKVLDAHDRRSARNLLARRSLR
jgi:hypothetical protein